METNETMDSLASASINTEKDWTIVSYKNIKGVIVFDVIPNLWFTDDKHEKCYYPPSMPKYRAKNKAKPEPDWEQLPVRETKYQYSVYDHAWENSVRMNANRSTKSASDNEKKGTGCRKRKLRVVFSPTPSENKVKSSPLVFPARPPKTTTMNKNEKSTVESKLIFPAPPKAKTNNNLTSKVESSEAEESDSRHSPSILALSYFDDKQRNKDRMPSDCTSDINSDSTGHTLASIGQAICSLSSELSKVSKKLETLNALVESLVELEKQRGLVPPQKSDQEILADFPFSILEKLLSYDDKLRKDEQLYTAAKNALKGKVEKTGVVATARGFIRKILDPSLFVYFNWKGQGDQNKSAFTDMKFYEMQKSIVTELWGDSHAVLSKLDKTCSTFLVQEAGKLKRRNLEIPDSAETDDSSAEEENSENESATEDDASLSL